MEEARRVVLRSVLVSSTSIVFYVTVLKVPFLGKAFWA